MKTWVIPFGSFVVVLATEILIFTVGKIIQKRQNKKMAKEFSISISSSSQSSTSPSDKDETRNRLVNKLFEGMLEAEDNTFPEFEEEYIGPSSVLEFSPDDPKKRFMDGAIDFSKDGKIVNIPTAFGIISMTRQEYTSHQYFKIYNQKVEALKNSIDKEKEKVQNKNYFLKRKLDV